MGRPYLNASKVHSRICGICPVAHSLCSIKAIEQALDVPMPDVAERLRRIFQCGQMVRATFFIFTLWLPSMMGLESSMEPNQRYPEDMELVRGLKSVAEDIFSL